MTSPNLPNPDSLEVLTATLNQALVETGRFFKSDGSLQSRAQMKRNLPVAHEKFQSALDHLSEQIFVAKAFLERDYEDVKARKAALRKRPTEDTAKGEPDVTTSGPQTVPVPEETAAEAVSSEGEPKTVDNTVKSEQQTDLNQEQQTTTNEPIKEEPKEADADQSLATQDATGTEELNFDSLLNNQGSNEFDLNLDFGEDGNAGNESFFNATFGNQDTGSGLDAGNTNTESGHDNSALPTGGDAFDLELEKFSGQPGDANGQFDGNTEDIMGPGESSFDDLFMESENLGGNANENQDLLPGDGLMQLDELDDSWFS